MKFGRGNNKHRLKIFAPDFVKNENTHAILGGYTRPRHSIVSEVCCNKWRVGPVEKRRWIPVMLNQIVKRRIDSGSRKSSGSAIIPLRWRCNAGMSFSSYRTSDDLPVR